MVSTAPPAANADDVDRHCHVPLFSPSTARNLSVPSCADPKYCAGVRVSLSPQGFAYDAPGGVSLGGAQAGDEHPKVGATAKRRDSKNVSAAAEKDTLATLAPMRARTQPGLESPAAYSYFTNRNHQLTLMDVAGADAPLDAAWVSVSAIHRRYRSLEHTCCLRCSWQESPQLVTHPAFASVRCRSAE
jgi:hypothetical protein